MTETLTIDHLTYALLLLGSISVPLALSFEKNVQFYKRWGPLFAGILITAAVFIVWDIWFTAEGVWHFNKEFTTGWRIYGLPWEEWLFFIIIPYACLFIYEVTRYYLPVVNVPRLSLVVTLTLMIGLTLLALIYADRLYTVVNFSFAVLVLAWQIIRGSYKTYLSRFYLAYAISLIPFFIVNGVLTARPVVIYDNTENLALRAGTIPVEDFIYMLSMLLLVTTIYEALRKK